MEGRAGGGRRIASSGLPATALLLLVIFHLWTVLLGIDYGKYWDDHFLPGILADSVTELNAWPRKYFYGTLYSGIGYLALAPEWFEALPRLTAAAHEVGEYAGRLEPTEEIRQTQAALREVISEPAFLIRTRTLFALAGTLAIPFLFLAGKRLGRNAWSGVLAAAVLALSWEFNTQSRHIAIDAALVGLVALFLALLARAIEPRPGDRNPDRWLYFAAIECGFATGAKFHAALLLVPLISVIFARAGRTRVLHAAAQAASCVALTGLVVLVMNPGLLFDTVQVANDWGYTARDYWRDTDPLSDPYKSAGGLAHLREASLYVMTAALSPQHWLGLGLFGVALLGCWTTWRRNWKVALPLAGFVPVYLFVMSRSGLVLARNYLPVLPVLAILVMWGFEALWLRGRRMRAIVLAAFAVWAVVNGVHMVSTALSVHRPYDAVLLIREARDYIARHPDERFLVSRGLNAMAEKVGTPLGDLANARGAATADGFDYFIYLAGDYRGQVPGELKLSYFHDVIGSREVNYDYYPNWIGRGLDRRAYVLAHDKAWRLIQALPR